MSYPAKKIRDLSLRDLSYGVFVKTTPFAPVKLPFHHQKIKELLSSDVSLRLNRIEDRVQNLQKLNHDCFAFQKEEQKKREEVEIKLEENTGKHRESQYKFLSIFEDLNTDIQGLKSNMEMIQGSLDEMENQWDQWDQFVRAIESNQEMYRVSEVQRDRDAIASKKNIVALEEDLQEDLLHLQTIRNRPDRPEEEGRDASGTAQGSHERLEENITDSFLSEKEIPFEMNMLDRSLPQEKSILQDATVIREGYSIPGIVLSSLDSEYLPEQDLAPITFSTSLFLSMESHGSEYSERPTLYDLLEEELSAEDGVPKVSQVVRDSAVPSLNLNFIAIIGNKDVDIDEV